MIDTRLGDIFIAAEGDIGNPELHVEPGRGLTFLKQLRIEYAAIKLGGRLGVGNGHPVVFQTRVFERKVGGLRGAVCDPGAGPGAQKLKSPAPGVLVCAHVFLPRTITAFPGYPGGAAGRCCLPRS